MTYELPYLTRVNRSAAIVQVPWRDTAVAAEAIAELLLDSARRREMGACGKQEMEALEAFDFAAAWTGILRNVENGGGNPPPVSPDAQNELIAAFDLVTRQMCQKQVQLHTELAALQAAPTGLGKLLRKSKTAIRILKERGLGGVIQTAKDKFN